MSNMVKKESIFLRDWKERMYNLIKMQYGDKYDLDKDKIYAYLDKEIEKKCKNRKVVIYNNYIERMFNATILDLIDLIEEKQFIIGGGGALFIQHVDKTEEGANVLIAYIMHGMDARDFHKAERKKYEKGTDEWLREDIMQGSIIKIRLNSLYGVGGYKGFSLYNLFIAEAITNQGRQIICSAIQCFEGFLGDNQNFHNEEMLYTFINNVHNEYKTKYKDRLDVTLFDVEDLDNKLITRLISKCKFEVSDDIVMSIQSIVKSRSKCEKLLLYYKNNLAAFNENQFIKDKYKYVVNELDELLLPNINIIKDPEIKQCAQDIWDFYEVFVLYDYPIFDRVRSAMYCDLETIKATDTDSNFIGLSPMINYLKNDVLNNQFNKSEDSLDFICVNLVTYYLGLVVDRAMKTLCRYMNVTEEYAKFLIMKNEFYLRRILFTNVKKRYLSLAILQEGQLLGGGLGMEEIKGFDFKKSSTKPFVRDYYIDIILNDILRAKRINVPVIYKKLLELKADIIRSTTSGESKYFKQTKVQLLDHYAIPYSNQGVTSSILWDVLCPNYPLELPGGVDIVPIKDLTFAKPAKNKNESDEDYQARLLDQGIPSTERLFKNKNIEWFAKTYPEAYGRIYEKIYCNPNPKIRHMSLKNLAKPKNDNIPLEPWFVDIVNHEKIVNDTLGLFTSILNTLGVKSLSTKAGSTHMTNVIDL